MSPRHLVAKLTSKSLSLAETAWIKMRIWYWNCFPEYNIHPTVWIGRGVRLSTRPKPSGPLGHINIGAHCRICDGTTLATFGGHIAIGPLSYIGPNTLIFGHGGVEIGTSALIAGQVFIVAANHEFSRTDIPIALQGDSKRGISIGNDVWLGASVKVVDGVRIGCGSVVAAGAVVTRSLPEYSISRGVPARVTGSRIAQSPNREP